MYLYVNIKRKNILIYSRKNKPLYVNIKRKNVLIYSRKKQTV